MKSSLNFSRVDMSNYANLSFTCFEFGTNWKRWGFSCTKKKMLKVILEQEERLPKNKSVWKQMCTRNTCLIAYINKLKQHDTIIGNFGWIGMKLWIKFYLAQLSICITFYNLFHLIGTKHEIMAGNQHTLKCSYAKSSRQAPTTPLGMFSLLT